MLLCPFDRQPTELGDSGVWGLKKNFALLELLERLQLAREGSGGALWTENRHSSGMKVRVVPQLAREGSGGALWAENRPFSGMKVKVLFHS